MATVSFIPESRQSISAMKAVIEYCLQQKKVADADSGRRLVSGVNCSGENAFTEFMATKTAHHKKGGMNFYHYVQSFSPNENISAEKVHKIGLEFAEKAWPGHEVLVTTHTDAEHLHRDDDAHRATGLFDRCEAFEFKVGGVGVDFEDGLVVIEILG